READFPRGRDSLTFVSQQVRAGRQWNAMRGGKATRAMFQTECADIVRRWPDKDDSCGRAGFGKFHIFGEKPIAGMDGASTCLAGSVKDCFNVEVTVRWPRRTNAHRLIRFRNVKRAFVGF